jgi:hypothetical protein
MERLRSKLRDGMSGAQRLRPEIVDVSPNPGQVIFCRQRTLANRIIINPYGRAFMQALPKCPVEIF